MTLLYLCTLGDVCLRHSIFSESLLYMLPPPLYGL